MKQQKCCNEIQNRAEQITITMRKSNIAYVNLIIPCKNLLQMIKLNKLMTTGIFFLTVIIRFRFN